MKNILILLLLLIPHSLFANDEREVQCMAENLYHEARGEGEVGMLAVAFVTMNRVEDNRFPDSVCEVVHYKRKGVCAFSWVCQGKGAVKPKNAVERTTWNWIVSLSKSMVLNWHEMKHVDITDGSTHYHATHVDPYWAKKYEKTMEVENHIFYVAEVL